MTSALSRVSPSLLCFIRDKITEDQTNVNDEERKLPDLDEWDNTFCDALDDDAKVDMILAANLLDIKPLLDIVCISVASLVKVTYWYSFFYLHALISNFMSLAGSVPGRAPQGARED